MIIRSTSFVYYFHLLFCLALELHGNTNNYSYLIKCFFVIQMMRSTCYKEWKSWESYILWNSHFCFFFHLLSCVSKWTPSLSFSFPSWEAVYCRPTANLRNFPLRWFLQRWFLGAWELSEKQQHLKAAVSSQWSKYKGQGL